MPQFTHGPTFLFEHKWNLESQIDKLHLSSWLVTLASGSSSNHLTSDSLSSQLVKSTCMVIPLKSRPQAVPRTHPEGYQGRGQVTVMATKQIKIDHFFILFKNLGFLFWKKTQDFWIIFFGFFCNFLYHERPHFDWHISIGDLGYETQPTSNYGKYF